MHCRPFRVFSGKYMFGKQKLSPCGGILYGYCLSFRSNQHRLRDRASQPDGQFVRANGAIKYFMFGQKLWCAIQFVGAEERS